MQVVTRDSTHLLPQADIALQHHSVPLPRSPAEGLPHSHQPGEEMVPRLQLDVVLVSGDYNVTTVV